MGDLAETVKNERERERERKGKVNGWCSNIYG
jgi:hypothetical protein